MRRFHQLCRMEDLCKRLGLFASLFSQKHFGLLGTSERVALLAGTMKMESSPVGGMLLQVEIPSPYPSIED
jgi:glucose-6-phosphate-specific signal transduction histidine kinase